MKNVFLTKIVDDVMGKSILSHISRKFTNKNYVKQVLKQILLLYVC